MTVDFTKGLEAETHKPKTRNGDGAWAIMILYTIFVAAVLIFALLGVVRTETSGNRLNMTDQEVSYVMRNLEKRSAADCVLTRTETGFQCREMATGRVFKVKTGKEIQ